MIKYFTIEDLLKHYLQKKFHILSFSTHFIFVGGKWVANRPNPSTYIPKNRLFTAQKADRLNM